MRHFLCVIIFCLSVMAAEAFAIERVVPESQPQLQMSFAPLVKRTAPAVVNIFTKRTEKVAASPLLNDPLFKMFLERMPPGSVGIPRERVTRSLGSGVIIRPNGYLITNNHVVAGSDHIRVVLTDRREFDAEVVITDPKTDLALLKIETGKEKLPYLELQDSDDIEVGDIVLAIGNPFGIGQTVTSGIISALARTAIGVTDYQFFIQTDAAINPGNSGGALVSTEGKLIGVNTAIFSKGGGSNGIGFATPSNIVRSIVNSIEQKGRIIRPWFGASVQPVNSEIAQALGLERPTGVVVQKIVPGSPVAKAAIQVGDVILAMDNHEIQDAEALKYRIATYAPGAKVEMSLWRKGQKQTTFMIMEEPSYVPPPDYRMFIGGHPLTGATAGNLSPGLALDLDLDVTAKGVVIVEVKAGSVAGRLGFIPGDMIEAVNGQAVTTTEALEKLMRAKTPRWRIVLVREGRRLTLDVNL